MEVKINKEIRDFTENVYFGLSLRQFIFSVLACLSAIGVYFLFRNVFNKEIVSWLCIIVAIPSIVLGFVTYNGMKAEQFIWVLIKYFFLVPRHLTFYPKNFYYELLKNKEVIDSEIIMENESQ